MSPPHPRAINRLQLGVMQQHPNQEESRLSKLILATELGQALVLWALEDTLGDVPGRYPRNKPSGYISVRYYLEDTPWRYFQEGLSATC